MAAKQVLIIQEVIKQYRVPFFNQLHQRLADQDIQLTVAYSAPNAINRAKADNADLPTSYGVIVLKREAFSGKLVYQHLTKQVCKADLVIAEQANKHLINYPLLLLNQWGTKKFAFWGHGRNLQAQQLTFKDKLKKRLLRLPSWWFAYTQSTVDYLAAEGFSKQRITNVENSIDMSDFKRELNTVTHDEVAQFRQELAISDTAKIGLFCGSMYAEKQLPLLFDSLREIFASTDDFHCLFIGAGEDADTVDEFCQSHPHAHYLGPRFGHEKAIAFTSADIALNPGLVGLGILDCFAAGIPMLTTDYPNHSPEIDYLDNGKNGVMTPMSSAAFAKAIREVLQTPGTLKQLQENAKQSSAHYSIERMAENFTDGIVAALANTP
ncbi:Uncharacterised protein [BD1-7 clade bacterium]|uniref:Uncharacterized protein n=1 Tax=BD1-7 clade bacterium TaxID=2029982 RepID=A0A5S9N006_9GAMM|nr:Uncharacterised protein [BD1-7 clade bacterium]CAA0083154.1 Uncharacterised protein [BD1-7 clade bacterium]